MNPFSTSMTAETGIPSGKKTHRGKRSRGKGPKPDHKADLDQHLASGDTQRAKLSALHLAKALHGSIKPKI